MEESPAERLRRAADLVEQRAEAASDRVPPPWRAVEVEHDTWRIDCESPRDVADGSQWFITDDQLGEFARWAALMSPELAAPLAAWLRERAAYIEAVGVCNEREALALADVLLDGDRR